jgi:hypothetical protein
MVRNPLRYLRRKVPAGKYNLTVAMHLCFLETKEEWVVAYSDGEDVNPFEECTDMLGHFLTRPYSVYALFESRGGENLMGEFCTVCRRIRPFTEEIDTRLDTKGHSL